MRQRWLDICGMYLSRDHLCELNLPIVHSTYTYALIVNNAYDEWANLM